MKDERKTKSQLIQELDELRRRVARLGTWEWDMLADRITWSEDLFPIYGIEPEKEPLTYKDLMERVHPEDRAYHDNLVEEWVESGQGGPFEYRVILPDGAVRHIRGEGEVQCDESGKAVKLFGILQDMTESKQLEENLRVSGERLRFFVEHTPAAVAMFDLDMRYLITSRRWLKDYGLGDRDIIGRSHYEVFPEIPERWKEIHRRCLAGAVESCEEDPFPRADGTVDWVRWEIFPWHNDAGEIGGIIMFTEVITERRQAEEALRASEATLRSTFKAAPTGIGMVIDRVIKQANDRLCEMLGYSREELLGQEARMVYPTDEDYDFVGREKYRQISELGTGTVETRWRRKDGEVIDVLLSSTPLDPEDLSKGVTFTLLDITERKRSEDELRRSEERYRTLFEDSRDAVYISSREGKFVDANQAALSLFGYTMEEMVGLDVREIYFNPDDRYAFQEKIELQGSVRDYEMKFRKKDGTEMDCRVSSTVRQSDDGSIIGYQGIIRDITERKRGEVALEQFARQQSVVAEVGGLALKGESLQSLMDETVRLSAEALDVELCKILELDESGESLRLVAGVGWREGLVGSATVGVELESQAGYTLKEGKPVIVKDLRAESRFSGPPLLHEHGVVSGVSMPMVAGDFVFGVMGAHTTRRRDFSENDIHFLESLANIVTTAILSNKAEVELKKSLEELGLLHRAGQTATKSVELAEALRFIVQETPPFIGATHGFIFLYDETRDELDGVTASEPFAEDIKTIHIVMDEPSAVVWVLTHNEPLVSSDARQDERLSRRLTERYRVRSAVFLPLKIRNRTLGVLVYTNDHKERAFDLLDRGVLSRIADQTALAVSNAKLYEQAREGRLYLETLIEHSMDAIISTDQDGLVRLFNTGAERMLGYGQEEALGKRVEMLYPSLDAAKAVMRTMYELGGSVTNLETVLRHKDGRDVPVLISATQLKDESGAVTGTVGFSKDITEIKLAHAELVLAYKNLERAQASAIASEKLAALGRLTAGVSHEILNPLNVITLTLHMMLEDKTIPAKMVTDLERMNTQAGRILKIAQDLLSFARQRAPERRRVDLNETVRLTLGLLERELKIGNVAVELELDGEQPPLYADEDQIQQVVLNLLTNARDAMPKGGRLTLKTSRVEPLFKGGGPRVDLRVEDTGSGIPPEAKDKVFDPFFTTKPEGEGTGLGLSICQGIAEAHGGQIWVEDAPGGGAAFVVRLPAGTPPEEPT